MPDDYPNVETFLVDLNQVTTLPSGRMTSPIRGASLWNFPNEGDELLSDHREWLDDNVVAALRAKPWLSCQLSGEASNDRAGVKHNMLVARRRAAKAKAYLLAKGVQPRQITRAEGTLDVQVYSTDAHRRCVDVYLERPVNKWFNIRQVEPFGPWPTAVPEGTVFFQLVDWANGLSAVVMLATQPRPLPQDPNRMYKPVTRHGRYEPFPTTSAATSLTDFNGADVDVLRDLSTDHEIGIVGFARINKPEMFSALARLVEFNADKDRVGKFVLVRGPEAAF